MTHVKAISRVKVQRAQDEDVAGILEAVFAFVIQIVEMKGKATE